MKPYIVEVLSSYEGYTGFLKNHVSSPLITAKNMNDLNL